MGTLEEEFVASLKALMTRYGIWLKYVNDGKDSHSPYYSLTNRKELDDEDAINVSFDKFEELSDE